MKEHLKKSDEKRMVDDLFLIIGTIIFLILGGILTSMIITSCTYSITMVHTEGVATDVVDEAASATADIKPDIQIPFTP